MKKPYKRAWYEAYLWTGHSRQKIVADLTKQAQTQKKDISWGGRYADGVTDSKKRIKPDYTSKQKIRTTGQEICRYPTIVRRRWNTYGKHY